MKNKLQNYFPIIRTRGEVLEELRENKELWKTFLWMERNLSAGISRSMYGSEGNQIII